MSWVDDILNGDASVGQTAACIVGAPFCLAAHVAERAGSAAERARADVNRQVDAVNGEIRETRNALPGLIEQSTEAAERAAHAATEPLDRLSSVMMWVAIAIGIVAGLIVLGVAIYFFWPVIMGLRSAGV